MDQFDWTKCRKIHSPQKWQWLFDNHKLPITEEQFISEMKKLKKFSKSTGRSRIRIYQPSKLKKKYKYLKQKFGFFSV